ncbi:MAG: ferrous iron transport protein A [Myxococcaceae bacterium]|nr:MAG: ferrous iron transport protein A [Myxococcaceae bacterium]
MTLHDLPLRRRARVVALRVDDDEASWLRVLGLGAGAELVVLRAGPLGGPLQVRVGARTTFAIGRALAARIDVAPADEPSP